MFFFLYCFCFFNDTSTTEIYTYGHTLSLHDALPISPGERVEYSCLGFITLGEVVRRLTGMSVAEYAKREVFEPLGMTDTMFTPPARSEEHTSEPPVTNAHLVCRLLLEKKKK